jgi:hypothetical protein
MPAVLPLSSATLCTQLSGNKQLEIHRTGGRISCGIKIGTTNAEQQANKEHQTDAKICIEDSHDTRLPQPTRFAEVG